MPFKPGEPVVVRRLGKGIVREVRRRGQYLVALGATTIVCDERDLTPVTAPGKKRARERSGATPAFHDVPAAGASVREKPGAARGTASPTIDLHGLTVEQALQVVDDRLNAAILAGAESINIIHGKGEGRIRAALHRHLGGISSVRHYELDARNPGVTHVYL